MEFEKSSNLAQAEVKWRGQGEVHEEAASSREKRRSVERWGWVAEKRLADLKAVKNELFALREDIKENRRHDLPFTADPGSTKGIAIRGLRLEEMGDKDTAGKEWAKLVDQTEKEPDQKVWYLLASQQRALMTGGKQMDNPVSYRADKIEARLNEIKKLAAGINEGDPEENKKRTNVRVACREIVDLYEEESTNSRIAELVKRARELAATVPKR